MSDNVAFRTAIRDALDEELAADERVILFGEDIALAGGVFATTTGLYDKYGPERVFDTPISELALAMDSLVNQSTKYWFLTQEQVSVPLTIRSVVGAGGRFGAIHSQMPVSWFMGVPGLKIVGASNPADAKALLKAAIRDDNPVLFFEHKRLYTLEGEVNGKRARLGEAAVVREGRDVTLVTAMKGVHDGLEAAAELEAEDISVEVVDLRTLRPFDLDTVLASVKKTNRIVVVEEGPLTGGWAGEVLASVVEHGLGHLDDAWRVATPDTPIPYSPPLEDAFLPGAVRIAQEIRARVR
jgi:pyruvate/2-oxoglutarate/acetoin dehydrogenase E1 component